MTTAAEVFVLPKGWRVAFHVLGVLLLSAKTASFWVWWGNGRPFGLVSADATLGPGIRALLFGASVTLGLFVTFVLPWQLRVAITNEGFTLNRFRRYRWEDVAGARVRSGWGWPHVALQRRRRWPIGIPLYYVRIRPVRDALLDRCPRENAILKCLLGAP